MCNSPGVRSLSVVLLFANKFHQHREFPTVHLSIVNKKLGEEIMNLIMPCHIVKCKKYRSVNRFTSAIIGNQKLAQ